MTEISSFFGIVIAMYHRDHDPAHFHARNAGRKGTVRIQDGHIEGDFRELGEAAVRTRSLCSRTAEVNMHPIHRVTGFSKIAPFTLDVAFDDGTRQVIDFTAVLHGELYAPLADPLEFDQVRIDEEAHTLVWPSGADFDPAILHDWPEKGPELAKLVAGWTAAAR